MNNPSYVAGEATYRYPAAGDEKPPGGAKVLLLTIGGICIVGAWQDTGFYTAWAPLPKRNRTKESLITQGIP